MSEHGQPPPVAPEAAEPAVDLKAANRPSGILLLVGALLLVVGCFLTWATVEGEAGDFFSQTGTFNASPSGVDDVEGEVDGPALVFIVVALVMAVTGVLALLGIVKLALKVIALVIGVLGTLVALLVLFLIMTDDFIKFEGTLEGLPTSLGAGIVVCSLGGILTVVGAARLRRQVP